MEKYFSNKVISELVDDFFIEEQVIGTHFSGTRLRIDAVLRPKNYKIWKNPNVSFGVEFKSEENLDGTKDSMLWLKQCIDYANTKWDGYGYLFVFSCPSIFANLDYAVGNNEWLWNRLLSNLGVGKLQNHKSYGWTFFLQDEHRIWSKKDGVICGKHWSLERKFGRVGKFT